MIDLQIGGYSMMKRLNAILLTIMLCTALCCTGASANVWGLTGKLYQIVEQSKAWDDYTTLSNQDGPFAVMQARYHNALFFADDQDKHADRMPPQNARAFGESKFKNKQEILHR